MDTRKNEPVISKKVHEGSARSIVQSYYTKGLLSTSGEDGVISFFFLDNLSLVLQNSRNLFCFDALHRYISKSTIVKKKGKNVLHPRKTFAQYSLIEIGLPYNKVSTLFDIKFT